MTIEIEIDVEALREEINILKEQLKHHVPELQVDYNLDTESLEVILYQAGKTITVCMNKEEFRHFSNNELIREYVDELVGIYKTNLSLQLANQLLPLTENLKRKNLI